MRPRVACVLSCLFIVQAGKAQPAPDSDAAVLPKYSVEVIVFTYRDSDSAGNEIFVPDKPVPAPRADELPEATADQDVYAGTESVAQDGTELPRRVDALQDSLTGGLRELPTRERIELQLLDPEHFTMDEIYQRLVRLDAYEPVLHTAWQQTTPEKDKAPEIRLRALGTPPLGLDGTLKLYRGRFVHLSVDLALDAEGQRPAMSATDRLVAYGDARTGYDDDAAAFGNAQRRPVLYRIVEDRIMRHGDIRYFDHPKFGVIAKVHVVDEDDLPEEDPADLEAELAAESR